MLTNCSARWWKSATVFSIHLACLIGLSIPSPAQGPSSVELALEPAFGITILPLWPTDASGTGHHLETANLTMFTPIHPNGTAVIILPGGAYRVLAMNLEGRQMADWFTSRGVTAFVLKYRLGADNPFPIPLEDARQALRLVRSLDKKYGISSNRVGMVGFSAGGHLAATTGTVVDSPNSQDAEHFEEKSRPDFLVLAYPWLNAMEPSSNGMISYCSVIPTIPPERCKVLDEAYTPKLHVDAKTPPTFIYATTDDRTVPVSASVNFYTALVAAGVPAELHIFRHGNHGSGLGQGSAALDQWPSLMEAWLRDLGLLTPEKTATDALK